MRFRKMLRASLLRELSLTRNRQFMMDGCSFQHHYASQGHLIFLLLNLEYAKRIM